MIRRAAFVIVLLAVVLGPGPVAHAGASQAAEVGPQTVAVGTYIQNLSDVDLKTGTFRADFYLWFRWRGEIDPTLTYEFTNSIPQQLNQAAGGVDENGKPKPDVLDDGQKIQVFHVQGVFVHPFQVDDFPLDSQDLVISIEDLRYDTSTLVYEADTGSEVRRDMSITGWKPRHLTSGVVPNLYTTNFGYPGGENSVFSHADFSVHVVRPGASAIIVVVFPLLVIIVIALMSLVIDPPSLEACLFLAPPALIAAVALHFTTTTGLPSEGRVLLIDKIYLLSYLVILLVLAFGVFSHRQRDRGRAKRARMVDRIGLITLAPLFLVGTWLLIAFR